MAVIVLVCGGRDYVDRDKVFQTLDEIHAKTPISIIIQGAATGADLLGELWARDRFIRSQSFPADWKAHNSAAGPIRNLQMLVKGKPNLVVAFPGGRGTANMIKQAKKAGVEVRRVD